VLHEVEGSVFVDDACNHPSRPQVPPVVVNLAAERKALLRSPTAAVEPVPYDVRVTTNGRKVVLTGQDVQVTDLLIALRDIPPNGRLGAAVRLASVSDE